MIYEIAKEISTELQSKGCPFWRIVYGPERSPHAVTEVRIVLERDRGAPGRVGSNRNPKQNPRMAAVRNIPCVARIFAKSNHPGARVHEHERFSDVMIDLFLVALSRVVTIRHNSHRITSETLLSAEELEYLGLETWPGVVSEIKFEVDRGVYDKTWANTCAAEFEITTGSIVSTGEVHMEGSADLEPIPIPGE